MIAIAPISDRLYYVDRGEKIRIINLRANTNMEKITMHEYITTKSGRRIALNTPEENAKITQAALFDPDAQPWSDEELETVRPFTQIGSPFESSKNTGYITPPHKCY